MELPVLTPSSVTVMIKPVGALCNLDCAYCYYLPTKSVYDGHEHRMRLDVLESICAGYLPRAADEVTICWQGGEPMLAGLKFFEKAIEFQHKYKRPGQQVSNALQTNGTLLDDDWCRFLRANRFLIGLSMDGPPHLHDRYRRDNAGRPTHARVMQGLRMLQEHDVEYNILCVLNQANVGAPVEVFQYLLNLGSRWLQFIPEIVWEPDPDQPGTTRLADHCPTGKQYGEFLAEVFDLWFERYRQRVSIRIFDAVLNKLVHQMMPFCILNDSCHSQLTIEHNGDVYGCDHFVERRWQLAQIGRPDWSNAINIDGSQNSGLTIHGTGYAPNKAHQGTDIATVDDVEARYTPTQSAGSDSAVALADAIDDQWFVRCDSQRLGGFAQRKVSLPDKCLNCQYQQYCYGGCPEHRPHGGDVPEASVLCEGYIRFYSHCLERLEWLAGYLRKGQQPPAVERNVQAGAATDSGIGQRCPVTPGARVKRNDPCPCGSGLKFKNCCGKRA